MKRTTVAIVAAMAAMSLAGCLSQVESRKSEVEGGNNSPTPPLPHSSTPPLPHSPTVLASSFGWNATNATKCLQSAFDSGAAKVVVDRQAGDWIVEPVFLRSNQEVMIESGVVVRALPGAFKHPNDCLFTARGVTNVVLRGELSADATKRVPPGGKSGGPGIVRAATDATSASLPTLRMERDAYTDRSAYRFSEWRHTLKIIDSANVRVSDLAFRFSGGDGIYVGRGSADIDIRRVVCSDHYRQGISVISARNLTIADSRFINTKGTPPQCGIDFEPNKPDEALSNCLVENCDFDGNASHGIIFHLLQFDETTEPVSATVRNCRARGNEANGIMVRVGANGKRKPVKGAIAIEGCQFAGNKGRALAAIGLSRETASVTVKDTLLDARGCRDSGILIDNSTLTADTANLIFENCRLVMDDDADAPPLVTRHPSPVTPQAVEFSGTRGAGIESVSGTLMVERNGATAPFDFEALAAANRPNPELRAAFGEAFSDWRDLRPVAPDAAVKTATPMCRGKFTFLQHLPKEGEYTIRFRAQAIGGRVLNIPVKMLDMVGTDLGAFSITAAVQSVTFKATGRNLRRFEIYTRGNAVSIASPYPGQGLLADAPIGFFRENFRLYFPMPAEADKAVVALVPDEHEPAEATLLDESGAVLDAVPFQTKSGTLRSERLADATKRVPPEDEPGGPGIVRAADATKRVPPEGEPGGPGIVRAADATKRVPPEGEPGGPGIVRAADAPSKPEIWSVDVKAFEDVSLQVGGTTPILATEKTSGLMKVP